MNFYPRDIYAIQHIVTGRIYVGSSACVDTRLRAHLSALRCGKHPIELMQEDFDKHGENYKFFILDRAESNYDDHGKSQGKTKEHEWMDKLGTGNPDVGYNYKDRYYKAKDVIEITAGIPVPNAVE